MLSVGIDVGGTGIKGVRLDDAGQVVDHREDNTTPDDPDTLVDTIIAQAQRLGVTPGVPLGVAVAGFLDPGRTIVNFSPNISWTNRPLANELEEALGVPVVVENDANAACFGEYRIGAGRDATTLAMFTLGTGVGGAVMDSGRLLIGSDGLAGELGHIPVARGGERCGCGLFGCLETVASGTAIVARVRHLIEKPDASSDEVTDVLRNDDALQHRVFSPVAEALAHAIVTLRSVTNPDTVIIGGGVMDRAGSELLDRVINQVRDTLSDASFPAIPRIVPAHLGNRAGGIGAALLATQLAHRSR